MIDFLTSIFSTNGLLVGTIIPFLFVLTVVVFVHEMGHYLVGRWCGIGVKAFSIGFGPELFGFNDRHGTRWKLSAIPLGGYVKFTGDMSVTSTPDPESTGHLSPEELRVAFHTQPVWKRAATVFAGPFFNFLLTIAVFAVMFAGFGRYVMEPMVAEVRPDTPAAVAGFQPGDRFVSVDGSQVRTFGDVQRIVSGRAGDELTFVVRRGDEELTLTATPDLLEQKDALGNTVKIGIIGVVNDQETGQPRLIEFGPVEALGEAVRETGYVIYRTGQFLKRFVAGREDRCQLGGPVKIADMAGKAAQLGFEWLVQLVALLSVGIGVLNLLPIPPLDGGHLVFYAIEAVMRRPVSERVMDAVYRVGLFAVLAFMGFVFWNDLFGC
ncbi:RIP metalloprotease RseP [Nitratireductor rhodophyticola]|uniref:Zinc metalloprotease n=1 Tax=Nitratireductor rhodophyticola TaxID=2854036 RepID=A0ABS7R2R8_9HYPH|nr:RIP metalloprotease RseP [Nitratireductor rhodophyticola]MBY8915221.1 RIP metalloprotease RseP [Nitratireductor rhodophyticola]MBY8919710.1 RIP metalloprotease RseP [Nitratireductor rhodophyticola]MEC9243383.1 RIP metalloprotease RseP [Pseudomonadota bacterium]WPZ13687.1 RIP metalloprotease RseP [Nitratireductor rhodophyticola]